MQLVDPEEIPAMERLTQEVLVLREKAAVAESQGQEVTGNRRQQVACQWGKLECVCISAGALRLCFQPSDMPGCACSWKLAVCGSGNIEKVSSL